MDISSLSKEELVLQVRDLQHRVALLQKMVFGLRSERFRLTETPAHQLAFCVATEPPARVEVTKTTIKGHRRAKVKPESKKHTARTPLPYSIFAGRRPSSNNSKT